MARQGQYGPGPVQPTLTMGNPLQAPAPVNVSTAGVHPLVKASMLPRIKQRKMGSLNVRRSQMSNMSRAELRSRRSEIGRQPRA